MSEIEEELRRRILAERAANGTRTPAKEQPPEPPEVETQPRYAAKPAHRQSFLERKQSKGGIVGAIATVLLLLAKVGGPVVLLLSKLKFLLIGLKFGKIALTLGSMLVSMWAWGTLYGWRFGVGIVALIFVHECGHALAARLRGIPTGIMVFIPFMGAFVTTKRGAQNIEEDAFIGIMGPVVGTLGCLACLGGYLLTGSPFWLGLAEWGFFVNLFNLAPTPPLDGGWITPLFSPKLLAIGAVLLIFIGFHNPLIWILALLSLPRIISGWRADPKTQPFYQATTRDRVRYGMAYFGLAAFLGVGYLLLRDYLHAHFLIAA